MLILDTGTTNSKIWIDENNEIKRLKKIPIGVNDVAAGESRDRFKEKLRKSVEEALNEEEIELGEIKKAVAYGMITSGLGLVDIPHLIAPAGREKLAEGAKLIEISDFLPFPVLFIPGVKNKIKNSNISNLEKSDSMRGEETQVVGLMDLLDLSGPAVIINLSSHTKAIGINEKGEITCGVTTPSGQIFSTITENTLLSSSIPKNRGEMNKKAIMEAYGQVREYGFLRALMLIWFMDIHFNSAPEDRLWFLEGAIAGSDIYGLKKSSKLLPLSLENNPIILIGKKRRCKVYKLLLSQCLEIEEEEILIRGEQTAEKAGAIGAAQLANSAT